MFQKIKDQLKAITFSKKVEYRIRRIIEMTTLGAGLTLAIISAVRSLTFGNISDSLVGLAIGLAATLIAYRGLTEDLPRIGAMANSRRFWE